MKTLKWGLLYTAAFLAAFVGSALLKMNSDPTHGKYNTRWDETVGKVYTDLPYGEGAANKFDLYVPADKSQDAYGLVVYLHAGGFTGGDKAGDAEMLKWLCSKGYVAAGINYTLFTEENPDASVSCDSCRSQRFGCPTPCPHPRCRWQGAWEAAEPMMNTRFRSCHAPTAAAGNTKTRTS